MARGAKLARLSASAGAGLWSARRGGRRGDDVAVAAAHADVAESVLEILGSMKGAAMKLGQMLSYVDLDLAVEDGDLYRERLTALTDAAPPSDAATIARTLTAEYGAAPSEVFGRWEPDPTAVASIGQVHRAALPDGTEVAVKVQHPGIAEAVAADLSNVGLLARLARLVSPDVDTSELLAELRERVLAELDYQQEAAYQQAFAERYEGHPFIRVPRVFHDWCRPGVLVSEYVHGHRFGQMRETASQADKDRYGEIIFRFVFGSLYRFRIFNSDPHPGNFLFPGDGSVAFLDYGSTKTFSSAARERLQAVQHAVVADDPAALGETMVTAGLMAPSSDADLQVALDWFRLLREPMMVDEPATYSPEYARRVIASSTNLESPYRPTLQKLQMPADYLLLNRITFGVNSLLARLEPTANWHRIMAELSTQDPTSTLPPAPPATELGEQEAAFFASSPYLA